MTVATSKKVLETTKTSVWFQDFLKAVRGTKPIWAAAYGISKDPQVEDNILDYRKVANDLRRDAGQYMETSKPKVAKGSFGPTFAESSEDECNGSKKSIRKRNINHATGGAPGMVEINRIKRVPRAIRKRNINHATGGAPGTVEINRNYEGFQTSQKRNQATGGAPGTVEVNRSQKRKQATGGAPGTAKVCRACEGHHATRCCFYLFQERAPETWTPRPHLQKLVEQNLKDDPTLEEEAKRLIKNGRRNGEVAVD